MGGAIVRGDADALIEGIFVGTDQGGTHALVPGVGLEPTTYRLQGGCSTS